MTGVAGMGVIVEAYPARVMKTWAMDVGGERKSGVDLRERVSGNWQCMRPGICNGVCKGGCESEICWGLDAKQGARRYRIQQELVPPLFCSLFCGLGSFENREVLFFTWPVAFVRRLLKRGPQGPFKHLE